MDGRSIPSSLKLGLEDGFFGAPGAAIRQRPLPQSQSHGVKELLCDLAEPLEQRLSTLAIGKA